MLLALSSPFGFRSLSFLLWYTLPLPCVSPLCCPYIRLYPGFFYLLFILISFFSIFSDSLSFTAVALSGRFRFRSSDHIFSPSFFLLYYLYFLPAFPVLLSPCFSLLLVFASGSSSFFLLGLLRLAFRNPYSLLGWSDFASSSAVVLSLLLDSPFSFVLLPSQLFFGIFRFPSQILSFRRLCARLCVISYGSLFLLLFHLVSLASGISCLP